MSLRDQVARVFSRPKAQTPKKAMNTAARTPDQAKAENEKEAQLRELAAKRDQQTAGARASIAREHAAPHLRPGWAATTKTTGMIEAAAQKEADRMQAQGLAGIEAKTEAELLADAEARQSREQVAEPLPVIEQESALSIDTQPAPQNNNDSSSLVPNPTPEPAPLKSTMSPEERAARIAASEAEAAQEATHDLDPGREMA